MRTVNDTENCECRSTELSPVPAGNGRPFSTANRERHRMSVHVSPATPIVLYWTPIINSFAGLYTVNIRFPITRFVVCYCVKTQG